MVDNLVTMRLNLFENRTKIIDRSNMRKLRSGLANKA